MPGGGDAGEGVFAADGSTVGGQIAVDTTGANPAPELLALADGGFELIFSADQAVKGVRFDAAGAQVSDVDTLVAAGMFRRLADAAAHPGGGLVLAYTGYTLEPMRVAIGRD